MLRILAIRDISFLSVGCSCCNKIKIKRKSCVQTSETNTQGYFHDEIRYSFISAQTVESEYKFLARHQQKDIPPLLSNVYDDLNLKIKLMAGTDKETGSPQDLSLAQLGESMLQHLKTLHAIHDHLPRTPLVHKTRLPDYPAEKMDPESRVE